MSVISDARDALEAAVTADLGADLKRFRLGEGARVPGFVLGPPLLSWETACGPEPSEATFNLAVVVAVGTGAAEALWDLVPRVAAAVEGATLGVVEGEARPIAYGDGGRELPAYEITIRIPLG